MELKMLLPEERALLTDLQDKIISLLVEKQEAWANDNAALAEKLQRQIDWLIERLADIHHGTMALR